MLLRIYIEGFFEGECFVDRRLVKGYLKLENFLFIWEEIFDFFTDKFIGFEFTPFYKHLV